MSCNYFLRDDATNNSKVPVHVQSSNRYRCEEKTINHTSILNASREAKYCPMKYILLWCKMHRKQLDNPPLACPGNCPTMLMSDGSMSSPGVSSVIKFLTKTVTLKQYSCNTVMMVSCFNIYDDLPLKRWR